MTTFELKNQEVQDLELRLLDWTQRSGRGEGQWRIAYRSL